MEVIFSDFFRSIKQEPQDLFFERTYEFNIINENDIQMKQEIDELKIEFVEESSEPPDGLMVVLQKLTDKQIEQIRNRLKSKNTYNLRRRKVKLRWNPIMGDSNVILEM